MKPLRLRASGTYQARELQRVADRLDEVTAKLRRLGLDRDDEPDEGNDDGN